MYYHDERRHSRRQWMDEKHMLLFAALGLDIIGGPRDVGRGYIEGSGVRLRRSTALPWFRGYVRLAELEFLIRQFRASTIGET